MEVGFIGIGKMGRPMSERLLAAGFSVHVHNRSRGAVDDLVAKGAKAARSAGEVAERAAPVRERVCAGLSHLGIELDRECNRLGEGIVSSPTSRVTVLVVATDEDVVMARHARKVLGAQS